MAGRAYLQGRLAVGHSRRALGSDNHRHVEAVAGEGDGGPSHAEGLRHGVPGFLTEDGVYQLDDLLLCSGQRRYAQSEDWHLMTLLLIWLHMLPCWPGDYLFQGRLHVHVVGQGIGGHHKVGSCLESLLELQVKAPQIVQTSSQVLNERIQDN